MHHEAPGQRGSRQERTEAAGARSIECALAQRRPCERRLKVSLELLQHGRIEHAFEHTPSVAIKRGGAAVGKAGHAGTHWLLPL